VTTQQPTRPASARRSSARCQVGLTCDPPAGCQTVPVEVGGRWRSGVAVKVSGEDSHRPRLSARPSSGLTAVPRSACRLRRRYAARGRERAPIRASLLLRLALRNCSSAWARLSPRNGCTSDRSRPPDFCIRWALRKPPPSVAVAGEWPAGVAIASRWRSGSGGPLSRDTCPRSGTAQVDCTVRAAARRRMQKRCLASGDDPAACWTATVQQTAACRRVSPPTAPSRPEGEPTQGAIGLLLRLRRPLARGPAGG
jgi:hypothetical protein